MPVFQSKRPTILAVEDNHDMQDYLRMILSDRYLVVTADHGRDALDMLAMATPGHVGIDLVISDLQMPVMNGLHLLEALKAHERFRQIPVIMLTGRADRKDKLLILGSGADDFIVKPFDAEELKLRIANLLKNRPVRHSKTGPVLDYHTSFRHLSEPDSKWLEGFDNFVRAHFSDATLSIPRLAAQFAMSESTLLRQVKRLTGFTPIQYLQEIRLRHARELLGRRECHSIAQVAARSGYSDARTFSRSYKIRFGHLPSAD